LIKCEFKHQSPIHFHTLILLKQYSCRKNLLKGQTRNTLHPDHGINKTLPSFVISTHNFGNRSLSLTKKQKKNT